MPNAHIQADPVAVLKAEANRLRGRLAAETGESISHSESLERLAKAHGARDWNTLRARAVRDAGSPWPGPAGASEDNPPPVSAGGRVRLTADMSEDPDPVRAGAEGTVRLDPVWVMGSWQLSVDWDDGRSLALVAPPDLFTILPEAAPGSPGAAPAR